MDTFASIIDAFGGPGPFGEAIGIPDSHARTMKARDSIPASRWTGVVEAAERLSIAGVTLETMAEIEANRVRRAPASAA